MSESSCARREVAILVPLLALAVLALSGDAALGQTSADLTALGSPFARVSQPTGSGNKNIEVIRDGDQPPVGLTISNRQYDTYDGSAVATSDWIGYTYSQAYTFTGILFQEGREFPDGGWFSSIRVEVRNNGVWSTAGGLVSAPAYPNAADGVTFNTYDLTFNPTVGDGVRLAGVPGGSNTFVSVAELRAFGFESPPSGVCGDGVVDAGEACDDAGESAGCDSDCTLVACGDGTVNATAGEACDAAGESTGCDVDCTLAACGDGTVNATAGEACDDGNSSAGDGCDSACQLESAANLCDAVTPVSGTSLSAVQVAQGLVQPVAIASPPLDSTRVFVLEQNGFVRLIRNGTLLATPFLDVQSKSLCCGERGLVGIVFHPNYAQNRRFFVNYLDNSGATVIARYERSAADADLADPSSERILLTIPQPGTTHNGGQLAFGPDGYLYAAMGDGGGTPARQNSQDDSSLHGKVLRIDVDRETAPYYDVPADNPDAAAGAPLGLIWAKGLRNPWRFSFDRATGDLYIADVGETEWEEINVEPVSSAGGLNYGWPVFDGDGHCFDPSPAANCPSPPTGFTMPVLEYDHGLGCSVTGGHVYRGCKMPDVAGKYFYADYCSGLIRSFELVGSAPQNQLDHTAELAPGGGLTINQISSFGEDARGELYIADLGGQIYKIVPGNGPPAGVCGDGLLNAGEECDGGGQTAACDADCTFAACGDGTVNPAAGESCDDGNAVDGDGCNNACVLEGVCGDADADGQVTAPDGLLALRRAVGAPVVCPDWRCDVDGSGNVTATDAAKILQRSVGLIVSMNCPAVPGLVFRVASGENIGALQLSVDYSAAAGDLPGSGASVACQTLVNGSTAAFNKTGSEVLNISLASTSGVQGPAEIVQCEFTKTGPVAAGDFVVTVIDAVDPNGQDITPFVQTIVF